MVRTAMFRTPLIIRVVCLYVFVAVPLWMINFQQSTAPASALSQTTTIAKPITYEVKKQAISGQPARINIARLGIDLPVVDGAYDAVHNTWTLFDDSVQYATMTALPNDKEGNTFLYGHNTAAVLERVKDIIPGDMLTITATNGKVFSYAYTGDDSVTPDKTDILSAKSLQSQVTLMTCQGIFSETRRLLHFNFTGVS